MRICLLTSFGVRHAYVVQRLAEKFEVSLIVREEKGFEKTYRDRPDQSVIEDHFQRLANEEARFFRGHGWEKVKPEPITVTRGALNTKEIRERIDRARPDAIVLFGCGVVKPPVLDALPSERIFNIHQGLSPYYRGSGTNFWPFVEGHLEYIGVTLHTVDRGVDTGGIIAHGRPEIAAEDTLHRIGCKTIVESANLLITALEFLGAGKPLASITQWPGGKVYKRADLNADSIEKLRSLEDSGFVSEWIERRNRGETDCLQLIQLKR